MRTIQGELVILYEEGLYELAEPWRAFVSLRKWEPKAPGYTADIVLEYGYTSDVYLSRAMRYENARKHKELLGTSETDAQLIRRAIQVYDTMALCATQARDADRARTDAQQRE